MPAKDLTGSIVYSCYVNGTGHINDYYEKKYLLDKSRFRRYNPSVLPSCLCSAFVQVVGCNRPVICFDHESSSLAVDS